MMTLPNRTRPIQPAAAANATVLVVDNEALPRQRLRAHLAAEGCHVLEAATGAAALEQLGDTIDVVLLDLGMPGMNGFEIAQRLRKIPGLGTATIVAQTGWGQPEFRERVALSGFDAHFTKPVDVSMLLQVLDAEPRQRGRPGPASES